MDLRNFVFFRAFVKFLDKLVCEGRIKSGSQGANPLNYLVFSMRGATYSKNKNYYCSSLLRTEP